MSTVFRVILEGKPGNTPEQLHGKRPRDGHLRQRGGSRELLVRHPGRRFRPYPQAGDSGGNHQHACPYLPYSTLMLPRS